MNNILFVIGLALVTLIIGFGGYIIMHEEKPKHKKKQSRK